MSEKDLNIKYICNKTLLKEKDELVPIILEMIQESYKAGLCQSEFDNTMGLIEKNQELKKKLDKANDELYTLKNKYNIRLLNQISENIEPDCEDYYLAEIETKANEYDLIQTQQQEFIKYLENEINKLKEQIKNYDIWHEVGTDINFLILKKQFYLEILQKHKERIGVKNGVLQEHFDRGE